MSNLVKLTREKPEIEGGNTIAYLPEKSVAEALSKGWKRAEEEKKENVSRVIEQPKEEKVVEQSKNVKKTSPKKEEK